MKRKRDKRIQRSDIGWMAFALLLVLLQFWWLPGRAKTSADSFSRSIDGKLGLYRVLDSLYEDVRRDSNMVAPETACTMLVVSPNRYPNQQEEDALYEFVYQGGTLVFAPNWVATEYHPQRFSFRINPKTDSGPSAGRSFSSENDPGDESEASSDDEEMEASVEFGATSDRYFEYPATSKLVDGEFNWRTSAEIDMRRVVDDELVISSDRAEVITRRVGQGMVIISSSSDIFSNQSMLDPQRAELAIRIVEYAQENNAFPDAQLSPIIVNEYFNVSGTYRSTGILFNPALRSGTLQLMLLGVLATWAGFHRFGPAREVQSGERRSLTDSAQAVGNLQYRSHDAGDVVRAYLDYFKSQLRRLYGSSVRLEDPTTLATRTGVDTEEVAEIIGKAEAIARASNIPSADAAESVRKLSMLKHRLEQKRKKK